MILGASGSLLTTTLLGKTRWLTNTDANSFSDAEIQGLLDEWYRLFINEIINNLDDWDFAGEIATANVVADQQEYVFPSDILKVKRIEITYDDTNWYNATFFDMNETNNPVGNSTDINNDFQTTDPYVGFYDNSLWLYPIPTSDVSAGIKIWYTEPITELTATTEPSFVKAYHTGLCYGVARDYWSKYDKEKKVAENNAYLYGGNVGDRQVTVMGIIPAMKAYYSSRIEENNVRVGNLDEDYS